METFTKACRTKISVSNNTRRWAWSLRLEETVPRISGMLCPLVVARLRKSLGADEQAPLGGAARGEASCEPLVSIQPNRQEGRDPISDTGAMTCAWAPREINGKCRVKRAGKVVQSRSASDVE